MSDYQPGEIVDITIKGARVVERGAFLVVRIPAPDGAPSDPFPTEVPIGWSNRVTVERVAPAEWPPQPGDLWRDRQGDLWFARTIDGDDWSSLVLTCEVPHAYSEPDKVLAAYGPLTLVHREPVDAEIVDEQDGGRQS